MAGGFQHRVNMSGFFAALRLSLLLAAALVLLHTPAARADTDWGLRIAEAALTNRQGAPVSGSARAWQYQQALYLYGLKLVYDRTGDRRLLEHVKQWGYRHVEPDGRIVAAPGGAAIELDTLDSLMPGLLVLQLWQATGDQRFRLAADTIRQRLRDWPRTSSGAFWHRDAPSSRFSSNVIWADGSFMFTPFLVEYSRLVPGDGRTGLDEAARQLDVYGRHLQDPDTGLLWHAYDQDRDFMWARLPRPQHAPVIWCRAVGWYGISLVTVLDALPEGHAYRPALMARLAKLVEGYRSTFVADPGGWRQVMAGPAVIQTENGPTQNFVETSCSSMHGYVISKAVTRRWLPLADHALAARALQGMIDRVSLENGRASLVGAVRGTGIGEKAADYLDLTRVVVDDPHGLGAFLLLHETPLRRLPPGTVLVRQEAESGLARRPMSPWQYPGASGGRLVLMTDATGGPAEGPVGRALVRVDLPRPGNYRLWGRFRAPDEASNGFWLRVDGGDWIWWQVEPHRSRLRWTDLSRGNGEPVLLPLMAGSHFIEIAHGKPGTAIDALVLTTGQIYVPVDEATAEAR